MGGAGGGGEEIEYFSSIPKSYRGNRLPPSKSNRAVLDAQNSPHQATDPKPTRHSTETTGGERMVGFGEGRGNTPPRTTSTAPRPRPTIYTPPGRPRGAPQPEPGAPEGRAEQGHPPGAPGPCPLPDSPSPTNCPGRPPPPQARPRPLSEPPGSLSETGCGPCTRAGSEGRALPATGPRKEAAAAAPPRAPAPRASPRPRWLYPLRARGASPNRQPAGPPDG